MLLLLSAVAAVKKEKMRNLRLDIEYDGTNYAGWEIQNHSVKTIRGEIETTLEKITQEKIKITVASRTDTGVHANRQVANFKTTRSIPPANFKKALNTLLPDDIVITRVKEVPLKFDARKKAKSKLYRYIISNCEVPLALKRNFCWWVPQPLNLPAMKKAVNYLVGTHNFTGFSASGGPSFNKICTIKMANLSAKQKEIKFNIAGDHFLYRMVRNIVGTLVEVGKGKIKPERIKLILERKDPGLAGPTAPARGLFLVKVRY